MRSDEFLAARTDRTRTASDPSLDFLKRRYAIAILRGDAQHAEIIRKLVDRILNGHRP